ncbi:aminopeptidase P family N-terminal domain-containing protein [Heyndrickxia sp. NPDC080065]|uniref:aminopeptidase P family N-terminal domain-containing protein n=1 Tax=Heyndrickxia sp. NPDC080065 TaxID=3390568 RepID=UPI003CFE069D
MDASKRIVALKSFMEKNNVMASVIMNFENKYYMSGFKAITYSRPVVLAVDMDKTSLIIPALEENHAMSEGQVDNLYVYYEHPEKSHMGTSYLDHIKILLSKYPTPSGLERSVMPHE